MKKFLSPKTFYLFILLFLILRIPSLFEGFWYGDEGFYATQAQAILDGKQLYVDAWDHKPPMMAWIYLIGGVFGWVKGLAIVKFLSIISGIVSIYLISKILIRLKIRPIYQYLSLFTTSILLGSPIIEGNVANAEVFFLPVTLAILYLSLFSRRPYLIGSLLTFTFFIKPQAFIEGIAIISLVGIVELIKQRRGINKLYYLKIFLSFSILPVIFILFLHLTGALYSFIDATITNFLYVGEEDGSSTLNIYKLAVSAVLFGFMLYKLYHGKITKKMFVLINLLIVNIVLSTLSGRPYPHYLIQLVPILIILGAVLLEFGRMSLFKKILIMIVTVTVIILLFGKADNYRIVSQQRLSRNYYYYLDFAKFHLFGNENTNLWYWRGHQRFQSTLDLVDYYEANFNNEKYFYYGEQPWIYPQLGKNYSNKYLVWYHLIYSDDKMDRAITDIQDSQVLIIDEKSRKKLPEIFNLIESKFVKVHEIENFMIYVKNES